MRRMLLLLLAACSGPATVVPPVTSPENPAARAPACPVADAREPGFTVGNRWTYAVYRPWHTALGEPPVELTVEVARVEQVGPYRVAHLKQVGERDALPAKLPTARVAEGDAVYLVMRDFKPDAASIREALLDAVPEHGAALALAPRVSCQGVFCGVARGVVPDPQGGAAVDDESPGWSHEVSTAAVDGLGTVWATEGGYSPETGDGGTDHIVLVGWKLAAAPPPPAVGAEPAAARTIREALHAVAQRGDVAATLAHADQNLRFGAIEATWGKDAAAGSWKIDGGTALRALATATRGPCGAVSATAVVCPASAAQVPCEHRAATGARAVLELDKGTWRLTQAFAGGDDDIYTHHESDDTPPVPMRMLTP